MSTRAPASGGGLAFAIAWCEGAPGRVGEVAMLGSSPRVLGRGESSPDDPHPRLAFARERGGLIEPAGPIGSAHVSRVQLRVRARDDGSVEVENVGRLRLVHRGTAVKDAVVREGELLELGGQLLLLVVRRSLANARMRPPPFDFGRADAHGIVGESSVAWALRDAVAFVGTHEGHVLVHGASGTGKELVARAVHALSSRSAGPVVARNAATFPEALIDAELFGNAKNYPNAGMPERRGLIGEADGGTLFLDEFAELPQAMQAHLLRVLDAGEYQRLGEARARTSRFRLVAATNRALTAMKDDVLARLVHRVHVPGLDARREDVPLLARHLFARMAAGNASLSGWLDDGGYPRFSIALVRQLLQPAYATNVRELEAALWRALAASRGAQIEPDPADVNRTGGAGAVQKASAPTAATEQGESALSAERVQACLDENNGGIEATWRALGLPSRHALTRLVKKYGLEIRRKPRR